MSNDIESIHKALNGELADLKAANQRSARLTFQYLRGQKQLYDHIS